MARPTKRTSRPRIKLANRTLDARPDTLDFRDQMFEATLVEVPTTRRLADYRKVGVPILDQGQEGACTGFGLATVIHYLLRKRKVVRDKQEVSARMLYNMARRYDEWPGETYSGSSARGAMKGWHKHGVCSKEHWLYDGFAEHQNQDLFAKRYEDAVRRPLGAYLRVNHKDIVAMHAAISEVGILYATAQVHEGWGNVAANGLLPWTEDTKITGGHAFAIVAYDERGFWIQNSWAADWGYHGFAQVTYDDWLANGSDVWVARLGAPVILQQCQTISRAIGVAAQGSRSYMFRDLRPHIVSLGNDGLLTTAGTYGTSKQDVEEMFARMGQRNACRHLMLYAHGGLVGEDSAIQKIADMRGPMLEAGVYPLSLLWKTGIWATLTNILRDAISRRRPEGLLDDTKDFMLDRLDNLLEPVARAVGGRALWNEIKENAALASKSAKNHPRREDGGLVTILDQIVKLRAANKALQVHLVGHSAGAILLGELARELHTRNIPVTSCTLWAPACTVDFYRKNYLPALKSGAIKRLMAFTLTNKAERDDHCAHIYHKSLLYLVSNAFEDKLGTPSFRRSPDQEPSGEPILGMAKWIERSLAPKDRPDWVLSPNQEPIGRRDAARATAHGGFDDDEATLKATLANILGKARADASFGPGRLRSQAANRGVRQDLER